MYNWQLLEKQMKYIAILIIVAFMMAFMIEGPIVNAQVNEGNCEFYVQNIQTRIDYYESNTDLIISEYSLMLSNFRKAEEIYSEIGFSTVDFYNNLERIERFIEDIDLYKDSLISELVNSKELICENNRSAKREITNAKGSLRKLKQEINDLNSYLLLKVSPNIQKFK